MSGASPMSYLQYRTQIFWYYDLHRMYYDNQLQEAVRIS